MARIRAGARWKAVQIKRETKQLTDWKYYVKSYPWLIAGGLCCWATSWFRSVNPS